jgi:hypothetical protein
MEQTTWITMIAITGFVWGGSLLLLVIALTKESGKRQD